MTTLICFIEPKSLLICLSVLCAILLIGICAVAVLIAKDRKRVKNMTENAVDIIKNDVKTAECAETKISSIENNNDVITQMQEGKEE